MIQYNCPFLLDNYIEVRKIVQYRFRYTSCMDRTGDAAAPDKERQIPDEQP